MARGIGIDIVQNSRVEKLGENTIRHILSESEMGEYNALSSSARKEFLASRFAAKEALAKALGTGFGPFMANDVSVIHDSKGAPSFSLSAKAAPLFADVIIHLSISHEKDYSVAMVVLDGKN